MQYQVRVPISSGICTPVAQLLSHSFTHSVFIALLTGFQLSRTAESADSDDKSFSNFVEMLRQKGHVLDNGSSCHNMV